MKKTKIALTIFLLSTISLFSQTEKGKYYLGAQSKLGASFTKQKLKSNTITQEYGSTNTFSLSPQVGYFIADNFVIGIELAMSFSNYTDKNNHSSSANNTYLFAPFLKYYFSQNEFKPFLFAEYGIGTHHSKYNSTYYNFDGKSKLSALAIGGGISYFINSTIGLDLGINYTSTSSKANENNPNEDKNIISGITSTVGFTISL
jgi:outer membrane protein